MDKRKKFLKALLSLASKAMIPIGFFALLFSGAPRPFHHDSTPIIDGANVAHADNPSCDCGGGDPTPTCDACECDDG